MTTPADVPAEVLAALVDAIGTTTKTENDLRSLLLVNYDPDTDTYDVNTAAATVWEGKAAGFANLVDVSESGSSRKMSDLYKNAVAMASYYRGKSTTVVVDVSNRPRTRTIRRPDNT